MPSSGLGRLLGSGSRQALAQAMFQDVLAALRKAEGIERSPLLPSSRLSSSRAEEQVVLSRTGRDDGQSRCHRVGIRCASTHGFDRVLLVPGDTPLLRPAELEDLLMRCSRDGIGSRSCPTATAPARTACSSSADRRIDPSFGPDSLERHIAAARGRAALRTGSRHAVARARRRHARTTWPSSPQTSSEPRRGAQRTRGALRQLDRAGARRQSAEPRA